MSGGQFLKTYPRVANIDPGGNMPTPRCSLDFVIQSCTGAIDDRYVRIEQFSGQEAVSQFFEYRVELRADDTLEQTGSEALSFKDIIGSPASIRVGLPRDTRSSEAHYPDPRTVAFFNGVIASFSFRQSGHYECVLRPDLWRLSLSNDYRLYKDMTIRDLIYHIVYEKNGVKCDVEALGGIANYRSQDWLQAGESDIDFINNLLMKVNGYYYFLHDDRDHTVKFANAPAYTPIPPERGESGSCAALYYTYTRQQSLDEDDRLENFTFEQHLVPNGACNIVAQPEAAWEDEAVAALTVFEDGSCEQAAFKRYRVFQYGATQQEAEELNDRDEAIIESDAYRLNGQSTCAKLKPGHVFCAKQAKQAEGSPRDDVALMRPQLDERRFVVLQAQHRATATGNYSNTFTAASAAGDVLEHNPRNSRIGSIFGRVVSKDGSVESVHKHGLMANGNFCFDTKDFYFNEHQDAHSCKGVYVVFPGLDPDMEPVWVKLAEHMQSIPEEGTTVMVGRSSDDTEVPEIQSVMQQKGNKTILVPDATMENTSVGNNYSTSYGNSRGIRYGSKSSCNLDTAIGKIDAQYATGKFKDVSYSLGASYSYSAPDNADDKSGLLSQSLSYGNTISEHHGDLSKSTSHIGTSTSTSTVDTSHSTSKVGTSNSTSTVDVSNSASELGVSNSASMIGASNSASLTGVSNSASAVGMNNSSSAVGVNNSVSATAMTNVASATLVSNSASVTNVSNSANVVLTSNSSNTTAVSNSMHGVGVSNSINVVGVSNSVSATANATNISATASVTDIAAVGGGVKVQLGAGVETKKLADLDAKLQTLTTKLCGAMDITI